MSQTCHPASWPDTMWIHGTRTRKHFQAETTAVHNDDDVPMVGSTIEILWETDRLSPDVSLDEGTWWRGTVTEVMVFQLRPDISSCNVRGWHTSLREAKLPHLALCQGVSWLFDCDTATAEWAGQQDDHEARQQRCAC